jgi:hypothetical protein
LSGLLHCHRTNHALGKDDVRLETDQFVRVALDQVGIASPEANLDLKSLALDPAVAAEPVLERAKP